MSAEEVKRRLDAAEAVVLVEALPAKYFQERHLPGAINLPHDAGDETIRNTVPDLAAEIIVYCASGPCSNSGTLARRLAALGYENVSDFHEGKEGWERAGYAFEPA